MALGTFISRLGKNVPADEVFFAWSSGDLQRMLDAVNLETNPVDRHFLLLHIVEATYKQRHDPKMALTCEEIAEKHVTEFEALAPALRKQFDGQLPSVPTFKYHAILLAEQGRFDEAIASCEKAAFFGLSDGTKPGFAGRIERLKKQKKQFEKDGTLPVR